MSLGIKEKVKEIKKMETSGCGVKCRGKESLSKERHLSEDWRRRQ